MYTPTTWENIKSFFRFLFCRHRDKVTRVIKSGSDLDDLKIMGYSKFCNDCKNHLYDKEVERRNADLNNE